MPSNANTAPAKAEPRAAVKLVRCAIYTRKSSEEGLEQEFNSLDAQRDGGEAFIRSQAGEGWALVPDRYDDGGYTGGNTDRPGLQRLLGDIEAGKIRRQVNVPVRVFAPFIVSPGTVSMVLREAPQEAVGVLLPDGMIQRQGRLGSGGLMLPNHAPLAVAERFGMLEALHPGRIDLGLGRAPGTDMRTALALRSTSPHE